MAQPTPYNRLYNFTDFQTVNPTSPLPATQVDNELNAAALTISQIRANLGLIQRDDGALANQAVTPDSLSAATLAMINQGEYVPRGAWATATVYAVGDIVTFNAATYLALVAHTAAATFAADLAANKWLLIANGALSGGASAVDLFEGTGSQTVFTLSYTYNGNDSAVVFVGGVAKIPVQDFTISGTTLTFVTAPPAPGVAGQKNIMVRGTGVEAQLAGNNATTSAANAANSATAAAASATAAAGSASTAATQATNAAASASTASTQATNAAASAATATTKAGEAATSATNAAASATSASGSATTATTKAGEASTSATAAAGSASAAATSAATASTQAGNAAASATAAAGSASTASSASTSANTAASNAAASASAASTSATNAQTSATSATNAATTATNQASNAATSASSANTSATNAAASATSASNSATAAGASASTASTAASTATTASTAAVAAQTAAEAAYDSFDDRYLGAKASNPSVDNDGNALITGALHWNTTAGEMRVWNGTAWVAATVSPDTVQEVEFTATAGQTSYVFAGGYRVGFTYALVNGVMLDDADITATDGTNITFASALVAGDKVRVITFKALASVTIADIGGLQTQLDNINSSIAAIPNPVAMALVFAG